MVKMSHGPRAGSRYKMTKRLKEKGMPRVNSFMQEFEVGDYVAVNIEPSVHAGMPSHNFQGYTGVVEGKQGRCYLLAIKVGSVKKTILADPVHLRRIEV